MTRIPCLITSSSKCANPVVLALVKATLLYDQSAIRLSIRHLRCLTAKVGFTGDFPSKSVVI